MSPHLLSLPVETLDMVISFIAHPVDAYSLSRTCRHLHTHLKSQSNSFWYKLLRMHLPGIFFRPYNPEGDYYKSAKNHSTSRGCHLCFAYINSQEGKRLEKMGMGQDYLSTLGVRVCISCFIEHTVSRFLPPKDTKNDNEKFASSD